MDRHTEPCVDCAVVPTVGVHAATDGWIVGVACDCGEKQRVTRVFPTYRDAEMALRLLRQRGEVQL